VPKRNYIYPYPNQSNRILYTREDEILRGCLEERSPLATSELKTEPLSIDV